MSHESGHISDETFLTVDEAGVALANPILASQDMRWIIGNDPDDPNLFETCAITPDAVWSARPGPWSRYTVQPDDWSAVYVSMYHADTTTGALQKYAWVPNDDAVKDDAYDTPTWSVLNHYQGVDHDDTYTYVGESNYKETVVRNYFHIIDYREAEYMGAIDLSETFGTPDDFDAGGIMNGGWSVWKLTPGGLAQGGVHCCCLRVGVEAQYFFEDPDDCLRWSNGNGDFLSDNMWQATAAQPWLCNTLGSKRSSQGATCDANGFHYQAQYFGAVSFELFAPDGTGVGEFAYPGEIDGAKQGGQVLDVDSAYDGIYVPLTGADYTTDPAYRGRFFVGYDTFKGVISTGTGVEEDAPAAFSVAQNSPNPFNPTTTVSITLAEAGNVTVDVFNVAGQKVDTLVDGFKEAGSHSVVWDASDFSAGVYFCTVRSSDFSKTVKMTLLK